MGAAITFKPGDLVRAQHCERVVLSEPCDDLLKLSPLGGAEDGATLIYLPLEPETPVPATFDLPNPDTPGSQQAALLLRDALRLKLRASARPFRSFGNLNIEPRVYQLVPLLMALKLGDWVQQGLDAPNSISSWSTGDEPDSALSMYGEEWDRTGFLNRDKHHLMSVQESNSWARTLTAYKFFARVCSA